MFVCISVIYMYMRWLTKWYFKNYTSIIHILIKTCMVNLLNKTEYPPFGLIFDLHKHEGLPVYHVFLVEPTSGSENRYLFLQCSHQCLLAIKEKYFKYKFSFDFTKSWSGFLSIYGLTVPPSFLGRYLSKQKSFRSRQIVDLIR